MLYFSGNVLELRSITCFCDAYKFFLNHQSRPKSFMVKLMSSRIFILPKITVYNEYTLNVPPVYSYTITLAICTHITVI